MTKEHPVTVLLGPADADHFRVKVGRYGDRFYCDPLPGCPIAAVCDMTYPSISTVKKASGKDWSFVSLGRAAAGVVDNPARILGLDRGGIYDALKSMNQRGLEAAAQRGTNIHLYCESKLRGTPCFVSEGAPGTEYFPAVDAFFDQYQPELVAAEYVVIHRTLNGVGYGGTPDAVIRINGKAHPIDWKSRGVDSDHGAYPEEAAQIAAGALADYMIVEGSTGPQRRNMPDLDCGLIVSIKPDGCRVYPVDLDKAWVYWTAMHAWWVARLAEREPVGKPWVPKKSATNAALPTAEGAPASSAPSATPTEQKAQVATEPDEGGDGDLIAFGILEQRYAALGTGAKAWIADLIGGAMRHGVSFHVKETKSVRRFEIVRGLVQMAERDPDDETVRAVLATVIGDVARFPAVDVGHLVGSLSAGEAAIFARRVDELVAGPVPSTVSPDGVVSLQFSDLAASAA